jgi:hypothetical protein
MPIARTAIGTDVTGREMKSPRSSGVVKTSTGRV